MKKIGMFFLFLIFTGTTVFAANEPGNKTGPDAARYAHRDAMKEIKKKQRETRQADKVAAQTNAGPHQETFWDREGKRSGLGDSGNRMGTFLKNLKEFGGIVCVGD